MHINQRFIAQHNLTRMTDTKTKKLRGLKRKKTDLAVRIFKGGRVSL
jgi:hypothetical protein